MSDPSRRGLAARSRPHSASLSPLLAELPVRVRTIIDTRVFARLSGAEQQTLERLAEVTRSYVVAYDLRIAGEGLPLCAAVAHASLGSDQIAVLRAAEQGLAPWIALVAYARPADLRLRGEVLLQAAANSAHRPVAGLYDSPGRSVERGSGRSMPRPLAGVASCGP